MREIQSGKETLNKVDFDHLAFAVGSARRAGDVSWNAGAALRTGLEVGLAPTVGSTAELLLVLGGATFWCGHES